MSEHKDTAQEIADLEQRAQGQAERDATQRELEAKLRGVVADVIRLVNAANLDSEQTIAVLSSAYASVVAQTYERQSFLTRDEAAARWGHQMRDKINAMILARRNKASLG